jgi:DNA-binding NtrC family response regulator
MSNGKILAIDDERNIRRLIRNEFSFEGFEVVTAGSGEEGLRYFQRDDFDAVLLDIKLPKMGGIQTLRSIKEAVPDAEVIMITGYGDVQSAVDAMKLGARDYITKPFKLDELLALVRQIVQERGAVAKERTEPAAAPLAYPNGALRCPSPAMVTVYRLMDRIAPTDHTVLIQGETGVGKDVLAMQIHSASQRKEGPFVTLDCGLLTHNLAESELYGHRKGAFSGATEAKTGLVEKSDKGTLFLDEIGNIDLELQKKFLRFLETQRFRRIGETREVAIDARIILATNMNLKEAVKQGTMRMDLFYRMDVMQIEVPPLRDRIKDIEVLVRHFLKTGAPRYGAKRLSRDAMAQLTAYPWPGNIRELKSVINKAMIFAESEIIEPDDLPSHVAVHREMSPRGTKTLEDMERSHILSVLEETGGNQTRASEILGINRKTLYKKIHKYKLFS